METHLNLKTPTESSVVYSKSFLFHMASVYTNGDALVKENFTAEEQEILHPEQTYDWDDEEEMEVPRELTPVKISELLPLLEKLLQLLRQDTETGDKEMRELAASELDEVISELRGLQKITDEIEYSQTVI
ncbi:hypothetical protein QNI19_19815 [Cytophagaceae bacterium DM2B3-1]|uniref:Uncharacterized protein n=1 Tax=Xanthocytophaga flava TaxID=3048013 RepID=A0ABT7CNA2_9BACT|nr:hypothetical protein [Xanthocytophaga flavus]MDJ1495197.1 hypothetical protein [Xanthocytophaga flavus]